MAEQVRLRLHHPTEYSLLLLEDDSYLLLYEILEEETMYCAAIRSSLPIEASASANTLAKMRTSSRPTLQSRTTGGRCG